MDDRNLMQDILLLEKGACDLYMHGTIESSSQNINQVFKTALNNSLTMQDDIYKQMSAKGWYPMEQATQQQRAQVRQKYASAQM